MTTTVHPQGTAATPLRPGPLTAPLEIIRAAGARHRVAVREGDALPSWALIAVAIVSAALVGAAAAFTPDILAAQAASDPAGSIDA